MDIIISILIAGAAGWFAGRLMKGEYSALINIILGLIGGVVGSFIFELLGFESGGLIARIIIATVGAVIVIWLYRKFVKEQQ